MSLSKLKQKVLFICNQNENRSKTAEELFKDKFETKSAGLYNETPVTKDNLLWADLIVVMENKQRSEIATQFPTEYMQKRILSLNISDIYTYNQPELISLLKLKMKQI